VSLIPFATPDDLALRLPRALTPAETAAAEALLRDASGKIRRHTRQDFTRVENDIVVLRVVEQRVMLPQRPADKPTSISYADGQGFVLSPTAWWFNGIDQVDFTPPTWLVNGPSFTFSRRPTTVSVTYSHGYNDIPDDIVGIVCAMVARVITVPGMMPGLRSGALDDFQFALGGNLTTGALGFLPDEIEILDTYKHRPTSVMFR
jgi:hypothetical protein